MLRTDAAVETLEGTFRGWHDAQGLVYASTRKGFVRFEARGRAGDFLVVLTLQKGDPPPVAVRGEGLGAVATIGRRTVAFNGEKIVLGD